MVVNAGNANVFTGKAGRDACAATAAAAAKLVGCPARQVFVASTGVIGEVLPHEKLVAVLPDLQQNLADDGWEAAARGIMTTDTFPKASTRSAQIGDATVRITGIAKGSGMIAPDMATMLCFVFTDAKIPADALQTDAEKGRRRQLQLHDGRFRHLHLRHRPADRHRAGQASRAFPPPTAMPHATGCWPTSPAP